MKPKDPWLNLALFAFRFATQELGEKHWQRFLTDAKASQVPEEFVKTLSALGGNVVVVADKIFPLGLRCKEEKNYAVFYAHAMAMVKAWVIMSENVSLASSKLETAKAKHSANMDLVRGFAKEYQCSIEEVPDILFKGGRCNLREFNLLKELFSMTQEIEKAEQDFLRFTKEVEAFKKSAQSSCGIVVQLEEFTKPPSIMRFRLWLFWVIKKAFGKNPSLDDLKRIRENVEVFFSERKNKVKVILLGAT